MPDAPAIGAGGVAPACGVTGDGFVGVVGVMGGMPVVPAPPVPVGTGVITPAVPPVLGSTDRPAVAPLLADEGVMPESGLQP
jgi:hypothetical protein